VIWPHRGLPSDRYWCCL